MTYADRIEAIARAICQTEGQDPDDRLIGSGNIRWQLYVDKARAADVACLKALEEPTPEMTRARCGQLFANQEIANLKVGDPPLRGVFFGPDDAEQVWRAMFSKIDRGVP